VESEGVHRQGQARDGPKAVMSEAPYTTSTTNANVAASFWYQPESFERIDLNGRALERSSNAGKSKSKSRTSHYLPCFELQ
jgi:hypothetical protein